MPTPEKYRQLIYAARLAAWDASGRAEPLDPMQFAHPWRGLVSAITRKDGNCARKMFAELFGFEMLERETFGEALLRVMVIYAERDRVMERLRHDKILSAAAEMAWRFGRWAEFRETINPEMLK